MEEEEQADAARIMWFGQRWRDDLNEEGRGEDRLPSTKV